MFLMTTREKTFPVHFQITKPSRFQPGSFKMYYHHEWEAYQKSLETGAPPPDVPSTPLYDPSIGAVPPRHDESHVESSIETDSDSAHPDSDESSGRLNEPASEVATPSHLTAPAVSSTSSASSLCPPDFARHAGRCSVCAHPDRDAIDADFIRWRSPEMIAREYKLSHRSVIYRHAHSTGLFAWRRRELARVLEGILESAEHMPLDASDVVIRAARVYAHLDEHGNWFEPARINFLLTGPASSFHAPASIAPLPSSPARKRKTHRPAKNSKVLIRNSRPIEKSPKSQKTNDITNSYPKQNRPSTNHAKCARLKGKSAATKARPE
jgi:hypothetical protein